MQELILIEIIGNKLIKRFGDRECNMEKMVKHFEKVIEKFQRRGMKK